MLKELGVYLDEPKTLTDVKLRKLYLSFLGRDIDQAGLEIWSNLLATGQTTLSDIIASANTFEEVQLFRAQANGNPVIQLIRRDADGTAELYEAAFNTQFDRANLGYAVTGDIISLPYVHSIYVQNKLASSNVNINPFGIITFIGSMNLNPPDNSVQPQPTSVPQVLDDPNDNYTTIVENFKNEIANKEGKVISKDDDSGFYGSYYGEWELLGQGSAELDPSDNTFKRVDTYVRYETQFSIKPVYSTVTNSGQRRDVIYDENIKPKMSDIRINFSAVGMKPNTVLNAFFGDRNVTQQCIMYFTTPDGREFSRTQLITNSQGEIRGTFTYSENDLNFDAGLYIFALSDSTRNTNDRTTYASASFNGLGLNGYGEETFRTRVGELSVNKTSTQVSVDPRTVIVGEGPVAPEPVTPPSTTGATTGIDIIELCFVYGMGRRPTSTEKAAIYDKWLDYGISSMTTWNAIEMKDPKTGSVTNGNELFREYGFIRVDPVLIYTDRATGVVANGTDSADLRSKYLAAATYDYGRYSFLYIQNENLWPSTVNYMQFLNLDPSASLQVPWTGDLVSDCFNAQGKAVFYGLKNFFIDVWQLIGGWTTAQDYQGELGWNARFYNFVNYSSDGTVSLGTPTLPGTYSYVRDTSDISNVHVITTVWNSVINNNCMQPGKVVAAPTPTFSDAGQINVAWTTPIGGDWEFGTFDLTFETAPSYNTTDKSSGALTGPNGGGGFGSGAIVPQKAYGFPAVSLTPTAYYTAYLGSPIIYQPAGNVFNYGYYPYRAPDYPVHVGGFGSFWPGSTYSFTTLPYVFLGVHYGNYTTQIMIGIKDGETGNAFNIPVRITNVKNGATYDTWIPGSNTSYWDNGAYITNHVDIYTGYKGGDPLGLNINNRSGQAGAGPGLGAVSGETDASKFDFQLLIQVRDAVPTPIPSISTNDGYTDGGGGCPDPKEPVNITPNDTMAAGDLEVGQEIWTMHEHTGEWGYYKVESKHLIDQPKLQITFDDGSCLIVSETHQFKSSSDWIRAYNLEPGQYVDCVQGRVTVTGTQSLGVGPVVRLEIEDAHTYVVQGFISHNKLSTQDSGFFQGG